MLTKRDVRKIRLQMTKELNATLRAVVVCTLMLLLIGGLAWIGASGEDVITAVDAGRVR